MITARRPARLCIDCHLRPPKTRYNRCATCSYAHYNASDHQQAYHERRRQLLGSTCEWCGFVPLDACQLDLVPLDGDNRNEAPANQMTLCACCARLKRKMDREAEVAITDNGDDLI